MTPSEHDDRNSAAGKLRWAVPAAGLLLLVAAALLLGKQPDLRRGTSYDAGARGFRAAYLLLEELDYPVVRAKRPVGGGARWVLFPQGMADAKAGLGTWVRQGGIVVLAVEWPEFAREFDMNVKVRTSRDAGDEQTADGPGIAALAGGKTFVDLAGRPGQVWARAGGQPAVTIYRYGKGEVWLLNRPEFLANANLRKADNAVLLCRIADEVQRRRPGPLAFDEFVHGMRDRPGVMELLLEPPTLWVSVQGLLLLGVLLWHFVPRFGTLRPPPSSRRRSKEEFLNAMAGLLERKGDCLESYRTARDELIHDLEQELGLPAATPLEEIARETARRRPVREERLRRVLDANVMIAPPTGKLVFLNALNELETARDECFPRRRAR